LISVARSTPRSSDHQKTDREDGGEQGVDVVEASSWKIAKHVASGVGGSSVAATVCTSWSGSAMRFVGCASRVLVFSLVDRADARVTTRRVQGLTVLRSSHPVRAPDERRLGGTPFGVDHELDEQTVREPTTPRG
jgi:hypothetical protein